VRAFCGIDWASDHHDIAIVDETGSLLARARIDDSAEGLDQLLQMLAEHGDSSQGPVPVAIGTSRGLLVACSRRSRSATTRSGGGMDRVGRLHDQPCPPARRWRP
jgi:predicted NBD/HSP70 family sugar kinase